MTSGFEVELRAVSPRATRPRLSAPHDHPHRVGCAAGHLPCLAAPDGHVRVARGADVV